MITSEKRLEALPPASEVIRSGRRPSIPERECPQAFAIAAVHPLRTEREANCLFLFGVGFEPRLSVPRPRRF